MYRRAAPGLGLIACVAIAILGVWSSVATSASPVFWKNYQRPVQIEPTRININYSTGFAWATGLDDWTGWGSKRAVAQGTLHLNICKPDCAAGNYKAFKGRVTLFKIRHCGSQRRYRDIRIKPRNKTGVAWGSDCKGAQINAP